MGQRSGNHCITRRYDMISRKLAHPSWIQWRIFSQDNNINSTYIPSTNVVMARGFTPRSYQFHLKQAASHRIPREGLRIYAPAHERKLNDMVMSLCEFRSNRRELIALPLYSWINPTGQNVSSGHTRLSLKTLSCYRRVLEVVCN